MELLYITISSFFITLITICGMLILSVNKNFLKRIMKVLVSLSAGTMMGGAFLHLLPEAVEKLSVEKSSNMILLSFSLFFIVENLLFWRHCHKEDCKVHTFGYMNLIGDSIHNFTDGLILAGTFSISTSLGITSLLAIALHEIPQEISDFAVLLHSGFKRKKAFVTNTAVSLTTVLGGIGGYYLSSSIETLSNYIIPFAAGGFVYIAASDLIPEIRNEKSKRISVANFLTFILGNVLIFLIGKVIE